MQRTANKIAIAPIDLNDVIPNSLTTHVQAAHKFQDKAGRLDHKSFRVSSALESPASMSSQRSHLHSYA